MTPAYTDDYDWRPSFVIIGAVKAATTWALEQLQANPSLYLPDPEPHFFSTEYHRGEAYYRSFFEGHAAPDLIRGEKSADYLAHPQAPSRMAAMLPAAKLIVQLRNPIERAYSDYKMLFRRGTVSANPEAYLSSLNSSQPRFLNDGLYAQHLERWLDHFPAAQLYSFLYDDIRQSPRDVVAAMSAHIGVEPVFDDARAKKRANDGSQRFLPLPIRKSLAPFKNTVAPLRGTRWFEATRGFFARSIDYPEMTADLEKRVRDFYVNDVERLGRLIDRDLTHWLELSRAGPADAAVARPRRESA